MTDDELTPPRQVESPAAAVAPLTAARSPTGAASDDETGAGPYRGAVSQTRTLWEEGHEPGRQVVALGLAVALTVVVVDLLLVGRLSLFFDLCFVVLCLGLALRRPARRLLHRRACCRR